MNGLGISAAKDLMPVQASEEDLRRAAEPVPTYFPGAVPARPFPGALVAVGLAAVGGMGLLFFAGRRRNPRRRVNPLLVVGGVAAGLWWLGRRTVAQVQALVPAPAPVEPAPLEGAFD